MNSSAGPKDCTPRPCRLKRRSRITAPSATTWATPKKISEVIWHFFVKLIAQNLRTERLLNQGRFVNEMFSICGERMGCRWQKRYRIWPGRRGGSAEREL